MKLALWIAAVAASIGGRGIAALLVTPPLVAAVWYLMVRRDQKIGRVLQAATEKLRGVRG